MGETSNFYEKCSSLSKKGDEKSLRTLLQMGISGNKTARVALRKTRNKKLLKTLIDEYLDNIPSEYNAGMILNLAVKVLRKEYLYVHDGNNATKMLFDLLLILSKYDYSYAEAKLITIYNRTDLYSSKALEILGELHSEFAYKEFLKKIIIAEQETECFHTAVRLIGFFPEREKAIIEYIKILDDSRLVEVIHEKAQKALANKNKIVDESIEGIPFVGKKCSVLSNNIAE